MENDKDEEIKFGKDRIKRKPITFPSIKIPNFKMIDDIQTHMNYNESKPKEIMHSQECIAKMSYFQSNNPTAIRQNTQSAIDYLLKNGDVEPFGNLYTTDIKEIQEQFSGKKVFKLMLSPEVRDISQEKLKTIVKKTVQFIQNKTSTKFNWVSAIHTDREHLHAHIIIDRESGGATKEFPLFIPPSFVKTEIRKTAINNLNDIYGLQTEAEYRQSLCKNMETKRPCKLDYEISRKLKVDYYSKSYPCITPDDINSFFKWKRDLIRERLDNLSSFDIGIVKHDNGNYYFTSQRWKEELRVSDRIRYYAPILKENSIIHVDDYDSAEKRFANYKGKIISKHLEDIEDQIVSYLICDTFGEFHYFVEKNVISERFKMLREGTEVVVSTISVSKGNQNYQRPKMKIYDPENDNEIIANGLKKRERMNYGTKLA